jgi:formylglycine-generating enzyme
MKRSLLSVAAGRWIGILALGTLVGSAGCDRNVEDAAKKSLNLPASASGGATQNGGSDPLESRGLPLGPPAGQVQPRVGMVYVPPGALVVGTAPEKRPRRADREVAGEQIMLDGFYIDVLSYPNEEGAIPITNVTYEEARGLCKERGKRLCTELEWERACKGPDNRTYEYGETYQENVCHTGKTAGLRPSGYYSGCQSDFGVRDMHGGPFEWTDSPYRRGTTSSEIVLKGGNGKPGEVVGRCANLEKAVPGERAGAIGFRCCMGGDAETSLELNYKFPPGLLPRVKFDESLEAAMLAALPADIRASLDKAGKLRRERVWLWHPVANEEIHLMALCARGPIFALKPTCGLLVVRVAPGQVKFLAWVPSGEWVANLHHPGAMTHLLLLGGDRRGGFKRPLTYRYGDVLTGEVEWGYQKKGR